MRWMILLWAAVGFAADGPEPIPGRVPLQTGFLVINGVYNTELTAPLDILQHSVFREDKQYFRTFLVSPDGKPIKTVEGLTIQADYSFANCPKLDVLVIPSTETSMNKDLEDGPYKSFVAARVDEAAVVITLCDGAFALGGSGRLDGRHATTFPGDQQRFAEAFPKIQVHRDSLFVHHDKFITSVGGARSFEPALFLAHHWFGEAYAKSLAGGLVIEWDLARIAHKSFGKLPPRPR